MDNNLKPLVTDMIGTLRTRSISGLSSQMFCKWISVSFYVVTDTAMKKNAREECHLLEITISVWRRLSNSSGREL